jgi:hypothetical protein
MPKYPYRKPSMSNAVDASGAAAPAPKRMPKRVYISPTKDSRGFREQTSELGTGAASPARERKSTVDAYNSESWVRSRGRGRDDFSDKIVNALGVESPWQKEKYRNNTVAQARKTRPYKRP